MRSGFIEREKEEKIRIAVQDCDTASAGFERGSDRGVERVAQLVLIVRTSICCIL
jgi:hypothetical protein